MNNIKWLEVFDWLQNENISFQLKTLLSIEQSYCDFIRELESTSILIDDSGDFTEFLEIEFVRTDSSDALLKFLLGSKISFNQTENRIQINGYEFMAKS
ncbi:hypothetical protein QQ008_28980 [Fulvivirgaceae bacterium BMA10]|uniref:Uncharacterized protein n=1 Tax=Splendidivirga corallicola TaxID=3051826 RepID=A0ABT8KXG2_9BACT|nr:hypothetical protein [Fulvivirgaceae bacterium BMA10]